MSHRMPIASDEKRLYGHVASLPCQVPGCGAHGVQVAHSNALADGKGRSLKAYPWRVAAICPNHHYEIDQGHRLSREERRELWEAAYRNTVGELFARGLVRPV